jgi:uncharacterized protein (TIGR03118 family)
MKIQSSSGTATQEFEGGFAEQTKPRARGANRKIFTAIVLALGSLLGQRAFAQTTSYQQTNLVSDGTVSAKTTDPGLINPWGIAIGQQTPFWVNEAGSGASVVYDATGAKQFAVAFPPITGGTNPSRPTGIVFNAPGAGFSLPGSTSATFIFVTLDGTIAGWNASTPNALTAVDNSAAGAVYTGAALLTAQSGNVLLAANFGKGKIEAYDANFSPVTLSGGFTDPNLPAGFGPYSVHNIGGNIYVTYAQLPSSGGPPVAGPGLGYVDAFDPNGNLIKNVASGGTLNVPWGIVLAPSGFGPFGGDLLIGNFGDGTISAFDPTSFALKGQLQDASGKTIANPGVWDLVFGVQGTGDPNTLYFSAGLNGEKGGLFGAISIAQATPAGDFGLALSSQTLSVVAGQSGSLAVNLSPLQSFNGAVNFACSGLPSGSTCSFSPNNVSLSGSAASTTATITTAPRGTAPGQNPYVAKLETGLPISAAAFLPVGLAAFLLCRKRRVKALPMLLVAGLLSGGLAALSGCGGQQAAATGTQASTSYNVTITATSGALTHSAVVNLIVN